MPPPSPSPLPPKVGRYLKEQSGGAVRVVLADPEKSHLNALIVGREGGKGKGAEALAKVDAMIKATGGVQVT